MTQSILVGCTLLFKFFQEINNILVHYLAIEFGHAIATNAVIYQTLGCLIGALLSGVLTDRIGPKIVLVIGLFITAFSSILLTAFCVCINTLKFLIGIGMSAINCAAYTHLRQSTHDNEFRKIMKYSYIALFISPAIFQVVVGKVLANFESWKPVMLIGIGFCVLMLALTLLRVPSHNDNTEEELNYSAEVIELCKKPAFLRCCIAAAMTVGYTYGTQSFLTMFRVGVGMTIQDQTTLQSASRIAMVSAVILTPTTINLQQSMLRSMRMIAATMIILTTGIQSCYLLCAGFILSYAAIGYGQLAMKTEIMTIGKKTPGIAQTAQAMSGFLWECLLSMVVYKIYYPTNIAMFVLVNLTAVYLIHRIAARE